MSTKTAYAEGWKARDAFGSGSFPPSKNPYWEKGLILKDDDPRTWLVEAWFEGWTDCNACYNEHLY